MTPLGVRLREMRAERGVTLKEMAHAIGVSPAYLSALEHGKRGAPTWFLVQRIIVYFNIIWDDAEELCRLAQSSDPRIKIDTSGAMPEATAFANLLARSIAELVGDDFSKMTEIIESALMRKAKD
ncbi:MAG: helix-turn-helix domain-containing protein [Methylobacteriaceae bacterium]|nr:helix-turn-helix domain-containing protein [Rhodoblastus sp.]MCC0004911.1 helix-turn-helix domain-containing protein [Methylobacteriaceae bacterium]